MKLLLHGVAASKGKAVGRVMIVMSTEKTIKALPTKTNEAHILVTDVASPSWTVVPPFIKAIVSDEGGLLCHAAVLARELRIPAVVGTKKATAILKNGWLVKVDGDEGKVYKLQENT